MMNVSLRIYVLKYVPLCNKGFLLCTAYFICHIFSAFPFLMEHESALFICSCLFFFSPLTSPSLPLSSSALPPPSFASAIPPSPSPPSPPVQTSHEIWGARMSSYVRNISNITFCLFTLTGHAVMLDVLLVFLLAWLVVQVLQCIVTELW